MKCLFTWFVGLVIVLSGVAGAQIIADFEVGTNDFYDNGWGSGLTSVTQVADPSGMSDGVLAVEYNGTDKGVIQKDNVDPMGAQIITYFLYLPADIPDSISFKLWAQDKGTWSWTQVVYYAYEIPKQVWYPLNYNMEAMYADPNVSFDHYANDIGKMGIEFASWDEHDADKDWSGTIYVDNVSLLGAMPVVFADFETGTNDFYDNAWGGGLTSVTQVADPSGMSDGVLAVEYNGTDKGVIQKDNLDGSGGQVMVYYIYLPADTPDSISFKLWAQDKGTWSWTQVVYHAYDIPNEVWYPIVYNMEAMRVNPDISFDHLNYEIGKAGIEIANWDEHDADKSWSGTIYIDNASFLGTDVGIKYVVCDFESEAGGTQSFASTGWNAALTAVTRIADPTSVSEGVLNTDWDLSQDVKGSLEHGNINFYWTDDGTTVDTGATEITIDVYLPADIPQEASQLSIFVRDHDSWTWNEDKYTISDSTVVPGQWNTISFKIFEKVEAGTINPFVGASVGIQLYYTVSNTWTGSIYFDNVTLIGVEKPEGEIVSPVTIGNVETYDGLGTPYDYIHLAWVDNTVGTEKYQVYMSHSEITDIEAEGVIRIARDIPHGTEEWNYRPYSRTPEEKDFYFSVIAVKPDGSLTELIADCKVGLVTITTSETVKAYYDPNFAANFVLDGLDTEFTSQYKAFAIQPETAGGSDTLGWTPASTDMSFNVTFVVDDDYLYISADVTDDDLNATGNAAIVGGEAWMGDALEFYLGVYDVNLLDVLHGYKDVMTEGTGDYRISFCAWGEIQSSHYVYDFPGLESTHYQKFTGDGYIIEARIALDSLALGGNINVIDGAMLPLRIDGTDLDPSNSDESRTLITQWGSCSNTENWKRPSSWAYLEVYNPGGTGISEVTGIPGQFKLHSNYPNPFNPVTHITYEMPIATDVSLVIYDMLGNEVRTLVSGKQNAGTYTVFWDGLNNHGNQVTSSIYFAKFLTLEYSRTLKMILMK